MAVSALFGGVDVTGLVVSAAFTAVIVPNNATPSHDVSIVAAAGDLILRCRRVEIWFFSS